jgi:hypothetical protein
MSNFLEGFETYRLLDLTILNKYLSLSTIGLVEVVDSAKGERLKAELDKAERARLRDLVQNPLRLALCV